MRERTDTILTLANGRGFDLLHPTPDQVDWAAFAEHLAKEKRFNGATPDEEYSVAQHLCLGDDAMAARRVSRIARAYYLLHDAPEAVGKDLTTPLKCAIAGIIEEECGVLAAKVIETFRKLEDRHAAAIHAAAGLPWPISADVKRVVKRFDLIMFVTEWRDLMPGFVHPNWTPYAGIKPLAHRIEPWPWAQARAGWLLRAKRLLPALKGSIDASRQPLTR